MSNLWYGDDDLGDINKGLHDILEESFQTVEIDLTGSVAHATPPARTDPKATRVVRI